MPLDIQAQCHVVARRSMDLSFITSALVLLFLHNIMHDPWGKALQVTCGEQLSSCTVKCDQVQYAVMNLDMR